MPQRREQSGDQGKSERQIYATHPNCLSGSSDLSLLLRSPSQENSEIRRYRSTERGRVSQRFRRAFTIKEFILIVNGEKIDQNAKEMLPTAFPSSLKNSPPMHQRWLPFGHGVRVALARRLGGPSTSSSVTLCASSQSCRIYLEINHGCWKTLEKEGTFSRIPSRSWSSSSTSLDFVDFFFSLFSTFWFALAFFAAFTAAFDAAGPDFFFAMMSAWFEMSGLLEGFERGVGMSKSLCHLWQFWNE